MNRDRPWIAGALIVFLGLISIPVWYGRGPATAARGPDVVKPSGERECVAPITYMKTSHGKLLRDWRDQAVRQDTRLFTSYNGKSYRISLSGTCLQQCHADRTQFCDRCHLYNGVRELRCWKCHVGPQPVPTANSGEGHDAR